MSLVYNLIILSVCWVFYTVMTNVDAGNRTVLADDPSDAAAAGSLPQATTIPLDRRAA